MKLVRVTGKVRRGGQSFVAGFESNGRVIRAAPLIRFLVGLSDSEVRAIIKKNKWRATVLTGDAAQAIYNDMEIPPFPEQPAQPAPEKAEVTIDQRCIVCGKLGCFGYGVSIRRGESGTWYCFECKPD